jgi:endonuclease/exonuclease/phosphatase family metal-dependent hydrolase
VTERLTGLVDRIVPSLTPVPLARRDAMRDGPIDADTHRGHFGELAALHEIEVGGAPPARERAAGPIRIAVWNVEEVRHLDAIADTLAGLRPDVTLLSEVDDGMARSGNRRCLRELAGRLGHGYAYGVEFVELDLGGTALRAAFAGERNALGLHGNAVTAGLRLHRPFLVRLDVDGGWFGWGRDEPRVGGRMAIGAQVDLAGRLTTMVSVHLENNSTPTDRAARIANLLGIVERYDATAPVLIGGDLNSSTGDGARDLDGELRRAAVARDPRRLVHVAPHEPLFALMAERGFDWQACNEPDTPTQRPVPGKPPRPLGKIDWIFTRGLRATQPAIVPALRAGGAPSSDHDCLVVTVEPMT